jgi:hypothetical protein
MGSGCSTHVSEEECRVTVEEPEENTLVGIFSCRWRYNLKMDLKEIRWGGMDWVHLAQDMDQWQILVNRVTNIWFYKTLGNS